MPRSLYLVDGHAQIYRAYFAPFRDLNAPSGEPTRATYVFLQMLLNLIAQRRPDYLAVVLDADESKLHRKAIYPDYKAHRDPAPEDLWPQERRIVDTLAAARVPILRLEGWEADDILATLAARHGGDDTHVYLVSRDKDLDQVLGPHVSLFDPHKNEVITPQRLFETKGWTPAQAIEAQTLIGDTVDNVPGVVGVGPKTAAKLIQKYGSAQAVVEHADELTPKQRENVLAFAATMDITRRLVTLRRDAPVELDLASAAIDAIDWAAMGPVFDELGFKRLHEQLPRPGAHGIDAPRVRGAQEPGGESAEPAHFRTPTAREGRSDETVAARRDQRAQSEATAPAIEGTGGPTGEGPAGRGGGPERRSAELMAAAAGLREPAGTTAVLVNTEAALRELASRLRDRDEFAIDTETTSLSPIDADLVGVSLAFDVGAGYYVPVRCTPSGVLAMGPTMEALPLDVVRDALAPLLADPSRRKVGQNIKYDLIVLQQAGLPVAGPIFDTMIAAFVVDPARGAFGVDALCKHYFDFTKIATHELIGVGKQQITMDQVPLERITQYAAEDADYTWRLRQLLGPAVASAGVERLFHELEMPLVAVLTDMESAGVRLDAEFLRGLGVQMAARVEQLAAEVHTLAGSTFNLDSPKQLAEVLFDTLKFRVVRKTKTTRSTDADTLETLSSETGHAIFPLLLEYREVQKLRGTYVEALPAARSRRTGRVHTSYHQTGAVTGRLSSSEPNLQNIPIRTELGRRIRRAFVPRTADDVLIAADYSQVELRMLAHFCEDPALVAAFSEDQDIHAVVAAQVNGVALADVTREMRGRAKAVNFGIIYGQTAFGLAAATGMSRTDAQAFIDAYFARYARIRAFIEQCVEDARRDGGVRTIYGRFRPIHGIASQNAAVRNQAERFAVNTVIQGSAADLIKLAMVRLHARIAADAMPLRMLLQVHDELVCEGPRARAAELAEVLRAEMSGAMALRVPLKVDVAWADNWLDAK